MALGARHQFVHKVWQDMLTRGGVEALLFDKMRIASVERDLVVMRLGVEQRHTNRLGIVQGGVLATLTDIGGSLACASRGLFKTGVTTDLTNTYLSSGGRPGDELELRCHLQRLGRTMAYTFVEMYNPATGDFVARGSHTKYIASAYNCDENEEFD